MPFDTDNRVLYLGTTYQATNRIKVLANYRRTTSAGQAIWTTVNAGLADPTFGDQTVIGAVSPVDLRITRYSLGASLAVDPDTAVGFEWAREKWDDKLSSANTGSFDLWSVSLRKKL